MKDHVQTEHQRQHAGHAHTRAESALVGRLSDHDAAAQLEGIALAQTRLQTLEVDLRIAFGPVARIDVGAAVERLPPFEIDQADLTLRAPAEFLPPQDAHDRESHALGIIDDLALEHRQLTIDAGPARRTAWTAQDQRVAHFEFEILRQCFAHEHFGLAGWST